jgi:hypothetical protein
MHGNEPPPPDGPTGPPPAIDMPQPGLLDAARRLTSAGTSAASRRIAEAVDSARDLTGSAAGRVTAAVGKATAAVVNSLPDARTVKVGLGRGLILGGQVLMDPKAVVGSFAIDLGQRLAASEPAPVWLALVADDQGFDVLARGDEAPVRAAAAEAAAQEMAVLVCKVIEAHHPVNPGRPA